MNNESSVKSNVDLQNIEKVLISIKEAHYDAINTNCLQIKEENTFLRVGRMLKKKYSLKSKSISSKYQIEKMILKQINYESMEQFYTRILSEYITITKEEANENNLLVIIADLLIILKKTNVFLCESNTIKEKAIAVLMEKLNNEWDNEHFIIGYVNMFEIFPLYRKFVSGQDLLKKHSIGKAIKLISIFYLKEYYDYTVLIDKAIETQNEIALVKAIKVYPEALSYLVSDFRLTSQLSISTTTDILQLSFIQKDSIVSKRLISKCTKLSSENAKDYSEYYRIIIKLLDDNSNKNRNLIVDSTEKMLTRLIELKQWQAANQIIANYKYKSSLSCSLVSELLSITPFDNVKLISMLIQLMPSLYDQTIQEYLKLKKIKELAKLIQSLKDISLNRELLEIVKKKCLKKFYIYKYETCKNELDLLLDFIINDPPFFNFILRKYLKHNSVSPEALYLITQALIHSIPLTEKLSSILQTNFGTNDLQEILKANAELNTKVIHDYFGPNETSSVTLDKEVNVLFADTSAQVASFFNAYFTNSEYLGIDSEWKQNYTVFDKPEVSILQLCDKEEKNIIVIDMIKLKASKELVEVFSMLKQKMLIGLSFEITDISNFSNKELVKLFKLCTIINLGKLPYSDKMSLSSLYKQKMNKVICKYEQCSNWNNRPLRQKQLHYAALDSLLCVQLYKTFINK